MYVLPVVICIHTRFYVQNKCQLLTYLLTATLTDGLGRRYSSPHEVQPEPNLFPLHFGWVGGAEHDAVDTVRVTDEMIVADVVVATARELPDAQLTGTCRTHYPGQLSRLSSAGREMINK